MSDPEVIQCKHAGCLEPAIDRAGIYAYLCEFHKNQKQHFNQKQRAAKSEPANDHNNGSRTDAAERFLAAARVLAEAEAAYDAALEAVRRKP